jgi:protoporphyrinogen oxidase
MNTNKHLLILGAGPAGLAAAHYAHKAKLSFEVLELADFVGGNARTIQVGEHKFDTGAHRIHDKIPHVTAEIKEILGEEMRAVDSPSKVRTGNSE